MCAQVSRVLLLGPDEASNLAVALKLDKLCDGSDSNGKLNDDTKLDKMVLNLQTKYYDARVEVHLHQVLDKDVAPPLGHELHDYEALICVAGATEEEEFLHLHRYVTWLVDTHAYDVCLLVSPLSSTLERVKRMETWCQTNGVEFVALDDVKDRVNDADNGTYEKQGIARVLEALHCNMWRSMKLKPSPSGIAATSLQMATEIDKKTRDKAEKKDTREGEKAVHAEDPSSSRDESRLDPILQALELSGGPGGNGQDEDIDLSQLQTLIAEVQSVRTQGQRVTDEERRDRAAEVAMKLWHLLDDDSD